MSDITPEKTQSVERALEGATVDFGGPSPEDLAAALQQYGWVFRPDVAPDLMRQVDELLADADPIGAIKLYRRETGVSLLEAKNFVEARRRGTP